MKLIPITITCYASEKAIKLQTEELFTQFFQKGRDEATVCLIFIVIICSFDKWSGIELFP